MAFRTLYEDINQTMRPRYTSPNIRAMGTQQWRPTGTAIPSISQGVARPPQPPSIGQEIAIGRGDFPAQQPVTPPQQYTAPKVTPFMRTFLSNIQTMDEEQRAEYFDVLSASIKDRMDRWTYRIARGIPLTADQQTQYNSLRGAFNDIQSYLSNQMAYDEYLRKLGSVSPIAQAGQRY